MDASVCRYHVGVIISIFTLFSNLYRAAHASQYSTFFGHSWRLYTHSHRV